MIFFKAVMFILLALVIYKLNISYHSSILSLGDKRVSTPFKLLTYNVEYIPCLRKNIVPLLDQIASMNCDIVCFQEMFIDPCDFNKLHRIKKYLYQYGYKTVVSTKLPLMLEPKVTNSGLLVASKFKPDSIKFIPYNDCTFADAYAQKGLLVIKFGKYTIINTHLQAHYGFNCYENVVWKQLKILGKYIKSLSDTNVVLATDINIDILEHREKIEKILGLKADSSREVTTPAFNDKFDGVFYHRSLPSKVHKFNNYSDHYGVSVVIN